MSKPRVLVLALTTVLALVVGGLTPAAAQDAAPPPVPVGLSDNYYFPLAHPVRAADTRVAGGAMTGGEARRFSLAPTFAAARPGTSPQSAGVWVLNITVTDTTSPGVLVFDGYGQIDFPNANRSNLNWNAGQTVANQVIEGVRLDESFVLWISSGSADVIVDAYGFFPFDSTSGTATTRSLFMPLARPTRLYDTRQRDGRVAAGEDRVLALGLPSGAIGRQQVLAAAVTVTVTNPSGPGSLTTWDGDGPPPSTSTLNYGTGQTVTNAAIVPVACLASADDPCSDLTLGLALGGAAADVIVDVTGYWRLDPGTNFLAYNGTASPQRIGDSRTSTANPPRLGPGQSGSVATGLPTENPHVVGVHANLTAVDPTRLTQLVAYTGAVVPGTTTATAYPGGATATAGIFPTVDGTFRLRNAYGRVDVVVDLDGEFWTLSTAQDPTALARDGKRFTRTDVHLVVR